MITINDIITKIKLIFILFKCKILKLKLNHMERTYRKYEYQEDFILDELSNLDRQAIKLQVSLYF